MNKIPDDIDFQAWYDSMEAQVRVRSAADCMDQLIDQVKNPVTTKPITMPWSKTLGLFEFRPAEVTVFAGTNGSGKSMLTGMIALSLIAQGQRVVIASFEMKPLRTLQRMVRRFSAFTTATGVACRFSCFASARNRGTSAAATTTAILS